MRSNVLLFIGLLLIGAAAVSLSYGGIPYKSEDVVIDVGPLSATAQSNRTWPVPAVVSGLAIAAGIGLVVFGSRRQSG
jgi:hypothetical protein